MKNVLVLWCLGLALSLGLSGCGKKSKAAIDTAKKEIKGSLRESEMLEKAKKFEEEISSVDFGDPNKVGKFLKDLAEVSDIDGYYKLPWSVSLHSARLLYLMEGKKLGVQNIEMSGSYSDTVGFVQKRKRKAGVAVTEVDPADPADSLLMRQEFLRLYDTTKLLTGVELPCGLIYDNLRIELKEREVELSFVDDQLCSAVLSSEKMDPDQTLKLLSEKYGTPKKMKLPDGLLPILLAMASEQSGDSFDATIWGWESDKGSIRLISHKYVPEKMIAKNEDKDGLGHSIFIIYRSSHHLDATKKKVEDSKEIVRLVKDGLKEHSQKQKDEKAKVGL